jgi:hypothetical protein
MKQPDSSEHPTAALRRLHRWRMAFSGLVILIAGITIGAAGAILVIRPADHQPPPDITRAVADMVGRFRVELDLTPEQVDKIRTILRTQMEALEELRNAARPKIEGLLQTMKTDVDAVLTKEQKKKWQEITERFDRVFHRGMRPGGRGGPGPGGPRGDFRGGRRRSRLGDRFDANEPHRSGERGFGRFDPNNPGRLREWRGDPNGPFMRGGPRPDWQEGDFQRGPLDRRSDMNDGSRPPAYDYGPPPPEGAIPDSNGISQTICGPATPPT